MRRRDFIAGLRGAAAWPFAARAQQPERMRRVGVLAPFIEKDPESQVNFSAFKRRLAELGWIEGGNLTIDYRFASDSTEQIRVAAEELVAAVPNPACSLVTSDRSSAIWHEAVCGSGNGRARSRGSRAAPAD